MISSPDIAGESIVAGHLFDLQQSFRTFIDFVDERKLVSTADKSDLGKAESLTG